MGATTGLDQAWSMAIMTVERSGTGSLGGSAGARATARMSTWSVLTPMALAVAVLALLGAQMLATDGYSSVRDPLSGLEWTAQGWLFPFALLALGFGLFGATYTVAAVRRWGRMPAVLLALAGTGGAVAAMYPSDRPDALAMTGVGEVHRWASTAVLVLPLIATLRVTSVLKAQAASDRSVAVARNRLRILIWSTAAAGAVFLGGFLPAVLHTDATAFEGLVAVNGLSQRILALLMVACVWQLTVLARRQGAAGPLPVVAASVVGSRDENPWGAVDRARHEQPAPLTATR